MTVRGPFTGRIPWACAQDAEHDDLTYSWSYRPDNGVNMVITEG